MDDTGLPSSTGRESTMPSMGDRMVALVSSSSARSTAACAAATDARACAMRACATPSWVRAACCRFTAISRALRVSSSVCWGTSLSVNSFSARSRLRRAKGTSGPSASTLFFSNSASAAVTIGLRRRQARPAASRRRADRLSLSSSTSTWPTVTRSPTSTLISFTIPLAFDLISTFEIGSMRPVATTDLATSPRSTVASRAESMSLDDPRSTAHAEPPTRRMPRTMPVERIRLRVRRMVMPSLPTGSYGCGRREVPGSPRRARAGRLRRACYDREYSFFSRPGRGCRRHPGPVCLARKTSTTWRRRHARPTRRPQRSSPPPGGRRQPPRPRAPRR